MTSDLERWIDEDNAKEEKAKEAKLEDQTDGGSASYYAYSVPKYILDHIVKTGKIEVRHICRIVFNNDFDKSNIFKALARLGIKAGVDPKYDLNKCHFFLDCIEEDIEGRKQEE